MEAERIGYPRGKESKSKRFIRCGRSCKVNPTQEGGTDRGDEKGTRAYFILDRFIIRDKVSSSCIAFPEYGAIRFYPDHLENLKFNPLNSETNNQFSLCSDNDPDSNFYSSFSCNYYIEDKFNDLIDVKKHLFILHLNMQSFPGNFDKLTNLLSTLNFNFSMIGISETWLKETREALEKMERSLKMRITR